MRTRRQATSRPTITLQQHSQLLLHLLTSSLRTVCLSAASHLLLCASTPAGLVHQLTTHLNVWARGSGFGGSSGGWRELRGLGGYSNMSELAMRRQSAQAVQQTTPPHTQFSTPTHNSVHTHKHTINLIQATTASPPCCRAHSDNAPDRCAPHSPMFCHRYRHIRVTSRHTLGQGIGPCHTGSAAHPPLDRGHRGQHDTPVTLFSLFVEFVNMFTVHRL